MFFFRRARVVKSGPGPEWVARLEARLGDELASEIESAMDEVRSEVDLSELESAVAARGGMGGVVDASLASAMAIGIGGAVAGMTAAALREGGKLAATDSALVAGTAAELDLGGAKIRQWIQSHGAELVDGLDDTGRTAVRAALERGWAAGRLPGQIARDIRMIVGLDERSARSIISRRRSMLDGGATEERASRVASRMADRARKRRSLLIARHEVMTALNRGRQGLWEQLSDGGAFPDGQLKEWLTSDDERVCPICGPLDGKTAPISGTFDSSVGELVSPPAHVQCRCTAVLV